MFLRLIYFTALYFISVSLSSCGKMDAYENNITIPQYKWASSFEPEFSFEITDTTSLYRSYLLLRHTHAYAYKNIWIELSTRQPGDSIFQVAKFELNLQKADGQWLGSGFSDIWEIRYPLFSDLRFRKIGTYTLRMKQIMRDDPLENIMSAGIRIEKTQP
jgi:gliding motility-associated lipoprotein GldH